MTEHKKEIAIRPTDPMLAMIERVLLAPEVSESRISAIMDLRERQMDKEAEQAFNEAFASTMAEMPNVPKTGHNRHSGQRYSTLDDLIKTPRPILSKHGLSLNWQNSVEGDNVYVTAIVRHSQGHQISTTLSGKRDNGKQMNHLQGGGSAETYLKRYSGFAILGLSSGDETDDDGNSASGIISEEQYASLKELIEKSGANEEKLCAIYKIKILPELPLSKYADADKKLRMKLAQSTGE